MMVIRFLERLFILAEGRIGLNTSKVFAVAFMAGFMYSALCLDGDHWVKAIFSAVVCGLLATFFMTLTVLIEEEE